MKNYDIAVIIGRFQPVHKGHMPLFKKANDIADKTVCVIGSADKPSTPKNPFSVNQRANLILDAIKSEWTSWTSFSGYPEIVSVRDTFYQEQEWLKSVKAAVQPFIDQVIADRGENPEIKEILEKLEAISPELKTEAGRQMNTYLHGQHTPAGDLIRRYDELEYRMTRTKIAILGHEKDESSYYMNAFSGWDVVDIGGWVSEFQHDSPISASTIRDLWFSGKLSYAKSNLAESTYQFLLNYKENDFLNLKEDWTFVDLYRNEAQKGKYPVQFLTTDAVMTYGDEVLLIRRGMAPGKGQWALPGGFKDQNEIFFEACIRELDEETNIDLPKKVIVGSLKEEKIFDHPGRSSRGTTVSMAYKFVLDTSMPRPRVRGGDDAVQAWWFSLTEVEEMRDQIYEDHKDIIDFMTARN